MRDRRLEPIGGVAQRYSLRLGGWITNPVKIKSIQRHMLMYYMNEPAWAFAGQKGEHERLMNVLKRIGVVVETLKDHKKLIINITIKV